MDGQLKPYQRIVVKIGSSLLTTSESDLNRQWLETLVADLAALARGGAQVLVVSSGAIALGRRRMQATNPELIGGSLPLNESQAAAAIGQVILSAAYDEAFGNHELKSAQVLLTIGDTETRRRYLNAKATISTLLEWNVVPVINENDTVATTVIRYGDNDRLAARVASMIGADLLVLLSDIEGLYAEPPSENPDAELLTEVTSITPEITAMAGDAASAQSRGGMKTKIEAARIATEAGSTMVIASGRHFNPLTRLDDAGEATWFPATPSDHNAKRTWIAGGLQVVGKIKIDSGALLALEAGKSLLPAGITTVSGSFDRGDTVMILGPHGHTIGRGLIEYDSRDTQAIIGLQSAQIEEKLEGHVRSVLIHRDNLALELTDL